MSAVFFILKIIEASLIFIFTLTIVLEDERMLCIVKYEGDLFLPQLDFLLLIPNPEDRMLSLKMGIEKKLISVQSHPNIFSTIVK